MRTQKVAGVALLFFLSAVLSDPRPSASNTLESISIQEALKPSAYGVSPAPPMPPAGPASDKRAEPDWSFTPGSLCTPSDPDFAEYRYAERVPYCRRNVNREKKLRVARHYGVAPEDFSNYEFDHLIPVCAGGSSHDDNLWPQPRGDDDSDGKDRLEDEVCRRMRAGTMKQAEAVRAIYDWFRAASH